MIIIITITIMIMMMKIKLIIAAVIMIINSPFQPGFFPLDPPLTTILVRKTIHGTFVFI